MIIDIIQTVIYVVGILGLGYWVRGLKRAVEAQKVTIDAQKILMDNLVAFLNIADTPKMAERFEAYKAIVEHKKEAIIRSYEKKHQDEKHRLLSSAEAALMEQIDMVERYVEAAAALAAHYHFHPLDWEILKEKLTPRLKHEIETLWAAGPPPKLPPPPEPLSIQKKSQQ